VAPDKARLASGKRVTATATAMAGDGDGDGDGNGDGDGDIYTRHHRH